MKIIFLGLLLLLTSCSSVDVYPLSHFINTSNSDLLMQSKNNFKESNLSDSIPSSNKERNEYFISLENSIAYRNYLFIECLRILQKEHNLDLAKPVFASLPKWNNAEKWYTFIFNFNNTTMECDEVVNDKKEVSEYQIIKSNGPISRAIDR